MPVFGKGSLAQRATLHPDLRRVLDDAILHYDFAIIEGHRGKAAQDAAVATGHSNTPWPTSNHNALPSLAADLMPYPVDWSETARNHARIGFMMGVIAESARRLGVSVRFGMNFSTIVDLDHVELYPPPSP